MKSEAEIRDKLRTMLAIDAVGNKELTLLQNRGMQNAAVGAGRKRGRPLVSRAKDRN